MSDRIQTLDRKPSVALIQQKKRERKELFDKTVKTREELRVAKDETPEARAKVQAMFDDVDKLTALIEDEERLLRIQDAMTAFDEKRDDGDPSDPKVMYARAFISFIRRGPAEISADDRAILAKGEARALGIASGAVGGYTVPEDFYGRVVEVMKAYGGMRGAGVEVITTSGGADLPVPTGDDSSNVGEIVSEGSATVDTADPTFGQVILKAYLYSSKILRVALALLQDEGVNLEELLARWLGVRLARIQNLHFTTGDDNAKPDGVTVNAQDSSVQFAAAAAPTYDELVDLQHSLDPAYRPQARFMMHDTALAACKKIKNATTGEPLWLPAVALRAPDTILGSPYTVNQNMATFTTAAAKVMLFGDFSRYFVRDVRGGVMARLVERYAEYFQVGLLMFARSDGGLITPAAMKYALSKA